MPCGYSPCGGIGDLNRKKIPGALKASVPFSKISNGCRILTHLDSNRTFLKKKKKKNYEIPKTSGRLRLPEFAFLVPHIGSGLVSS